MKNLGRVWLGVCATFVAVFGAACDTQGGPGRLGNSPGVGVPARKANDVAESHNAVPHPDARASELRADRGVSAAGLPSSSANFGNHPVRTLSSGAATNVAGAAASSNLIVNAGAEEPIVTAGQLPGWTVASGSDWRTYSPQAAVDAPPFEGERYFYAGSVASGELRQDVDVSAYAALIDAETQEFLFQGFVRSYNQSPPDTSQVIVDYLNSTKSTVLASFDSGAIGSLQSWQHVVEQRLAPIGTRYIRVRLLPRRLQGNANDGYFDALSLQALEPSPNLLQNAGAEEASLLQGWTTASGTWQAMTFASCGVSTCPQPYQGSRWFAPSNDPSAELFQEVNVGSYASTIDLGAQRFAFAGQVVSYNQSPADGARIIVEYRNDLGQVLSTYDTGEVRLVSGWQRRADARTAPVNTRRIRVRLISTRYGTGPANDGYYDGLSLRTTGPCSTAQLVDDGIQCTSDACDPLVGVVHSPRAFGVSCSNFNACDGVEACNGSGSCVTAPSQINDGNPCTVDACNPTTGITHVAVASGTSCTDSNACNGLEACDSGGVCKAANVPAIDDGNPCTVDSCDSATGVRHVVALGAPCPDGNACNGSETCGADGTCHAGLPPVLADQDPCTVDTCDPVLGITHVASAAGTSCSDGNICNGAETCSATGQCESDAPPQLSDGDPCTDDTCDPVSGVHHSFRGVGSSCSDGDACNGEELCSAEGACAPATSVSISDDNPCTVETCQAGVISHTPAPDGTGCSDGNPCTADDVCQAGNCMPGATSSVDDGNPCTTDSCSATSGVVHALAPAGTTCSDGDACNGQEQCSASGACVTTSAPVLDDGNPCTVDTCSPGSVTVQHTPLPGGVSCADNDLCNGNEVCSGNGTCAAGTPVVADDGNSCTIDSCDPLVGVRHLPLDTPECVGRAGWARVIGSQPSPRDGAAGVFIGTGELLLFGGDNAGAVLADAWLWGPATRAWRRIASGPSARAGASLSYDAVRQRAVLFGGVGSAAQGAQYLDDVWEYDSRTDTWSKRTVTGSSPAPRALAAFAFDSTRGRALLFGGTNDSALGDTWEWDSNLGSWAQLSTSGPSARYGAAFAFDAVTGRYALFGGSPGNATGALGDTWLLAADTGVWAAQPGAPAPPGRAAAAMVFDAAAQRLVLVGGTGVTSLNLDDTWELNTATGAWSAIPTLAAPASTTGAVLGFDPQAQSVVIATGLSYSSSGLFTPQSSAVWLLDRTAERWTDRSSTIAPPQLRYGAAFDTNRKIIVALGTRAPPERPLMWSFDSRVAQWSVKDVTDVDHPFSDGEFSGLGEGTNALFYAASLGRLLEVRRGHLAQWDGERWTKRCDFPSLGNYGLNLLYHEAVAFDAASQRLYLFGGAVPTLSGGIRKSDVIALDLPTCGAEIVQPTNAPPAARENATATWDSERNRLIVFGGSDTSGVRSDTWEFNPVARSWTALGGTMPPARSGATSVYDPLRRRVLLHGGSAANVLLYDTWELDPANSSWRQLVTTGPSDGEEAALTFDTVRNSAALVSTRGTVWHLSGDTWLAALNPVSPSARSGFSGGYGSVTGVGVFFGGTSGDGQRDFLGDLWIWRDGWRGVYPGISGSPLVSYGQGSLSTKSGNGVPSSRTGHVLATGLVDNRSSQPKDVMVLFGGEGASNQYLGLYGDTWTFDVTTMEWTPRPSTFGPRGRTAHAMAVFPNRGYLMFGGLGRDQFDGPYSQDILKDTSFSDTWVWELSNSQWRKIGSEGPSARYGHAMATDETTKELILFGGRDANGVSGETWRLNLATTGSTAVWQKLSPSSSPLARFGHSMTWDPVRERIVLTGGEGTSASQSFEDTWEWDSPGQRWVLRNVVPLEGRAGHVSFFDRKRGLLLAFGGFSHREAGRFALTHGDTLAFYRPNETDPSVGFPNGARCTSAAACGSGACVDGFCCNSACDGQCGACDVPGFEGTCSPVAGTPHGTRPSCGANGEECASQCNGIDMTQCNVPPVGTPCGPAPGCFGDNTLIMGAGSCGANGACVTPQVSCGNYICCDGVRCSGPTACVTNCQGANSLCAVGYKCNGAGGDPRGKCYKPTEINSFTVTPVTAKVGVPMTFQVTVTEPNTAFEYSYTLDGGATIFTCSNASTCNWTPAAADAGKTAVWKVWVGNAPGFLNSMDDSEILTLTVQP